MLFIQPCLHKLQRSEKRGDAARAAFPSTLAVGFRLLSSVSAPPPTPAGRGRGGENTYTVTRARRPSERASTSRGTNESKERRAAACTLLIGLTSEVDTPGRADKGARSMPRRLSHGAIQPRPETARMPTTRWQHHLPCGRVQTRRCLANPATPTPVPAWRPRQINVFPPSILFLLQKRRSARLCPACSKFLHLKWDLWAVLYSMTKKQTSTNAQNFLGLEREAELLQLRSRHRNPSQRTPAVEL